ncbi:MAG TPA: T9SS type A sorting domain-containing protein [Ignavibacteriaceae bacterium]|nr:T9SS type A sorting domain-containing protein [Ignavibacteriaceae bacterium]
MTGEKNSTNVILNFSLDDIGNGEDFSFPLHVGDLWQYRVVNIEDPNPVSGFVGYDNVKAEKDTLMPNGEPYVLLKSDHGYILTDWYLRRDGPHVYQYSTADSTEYLLYDFSKGIGDTIGKGIIQDIVLQDIFGAVKKTFKMYEANTLSSSITDSIGIINMATGLSYDMELTGAVINNKTYGTIVSVKGNPKTAPTVFSLYQNYPNPFNPSTKIKYEIPIEAEVLIKVNDILGREVAILLKEFQKAGRYQIEWNAGNLASGIYFYSIKAGDFYSTKKMILLK